MTLQAEAAKAVAAERYRAASITSGERYIADRRAGEAAASAAEDARAAADRQSQLPVIVGDAGGAAPAVPGGNVTVARPQVPTTGQQTSPASAPVPLAAANVAAWVADESRFDPAGVADLQREWGADLPANLGFVKHWLHSTFTPEQREQAEAANILSVPVIRFIAQVAREGAHAAPATTITTTNRGSSQMAEQMSRSDAEKKFREATKRGHDLKARGDLLGAREAFAERDRLSEALYPGSSEPTADQSGRRVG
jgi:hypothetical protein